jgi:hypothetical protein
MTRPSEIRPREGSVPGTPAADFVVGERLPSLRFVVTPAIGAEYCSVLGWASMPQLRGRPVVPTAVLTLYQNAVLYQRFPPLQGIILRDQEWWWKGVIWADEDTEIDSDGRVLERFARRGRHYIRWSADFRASAGRQIATSLCTLCIPE